MFVDTGAVRHLAATLTERAVELRETATGLHRRVADVPWHGAAADAMRTHAAGRLAALLRSADLHDDAGAALVKHADAVDAALAWLASVVDTADRAVDATVDTTVDTAVDTAESVVDHTVGLLR